MMSRCAKYCLRINGYALKLRELSENANFCLTQQWAEIVNNQLPPHFASNRLGIGIVKTPFYARL